MEIASKAIETNGTVDVHRHLILDHSLPIKGPKRVRVIILFPEDDDIDELEWIQSASRNPSFAFLEDPEEDIYSINDGKPFKDEE